MNVTVGGLSAKMRRSETDTTRFGRAWHVKGQNTVHRTVVRFAWVAEINAGNLGVKEKKVAFNSRFHPSSQEIPFSRHRVAADPLVRL